jgi:hypothetical protein
LKLSADQACEREHEQLIPPVLLGLLPYPASAVQVVVGSEEKGGGEPGEAKPLGGMNHLIERWCGLDLGSGDAALVDKAGEVSQCLQFGCSQRHRQRGVVRHGFQVWLWRMALVYGFGTAGIVVLMIMPYYYAVGCGRLRRYAYFASPLP